MLRLFISIIITFSLIPVYGQKKEECKLQIDSCLYNLTGSWKYTSADFYPSKGPQEIKYYPAHSLTFLKRTFVVKNGDGSVVQTGKIKITTENSKKYANCDILIFFYGRGEPKYDTPIDSWDSLKCYNFWTLEKCDNDTMILQSPWTSEFLDSKGENYRGGTAVKKYIRIKE